MTRGVLLSAILIALGSRAGADSSQCRVLDLTLQPASSSDDRFPPQIVAWLEDPAGNFIDTIFITQATGSFGLGNRPGRFDFNSAKFWPYGRRITTFPVWSTKQPLRWPQLVFQDGDDNDLSHSGSKSSREFHYCRPLHNPDELDAVTCPSMLAYTDKGAMSATVSQYPPRTDLMRAPQDTGDVDMFDMLNPFDAVSQPTPAIGQSTVETFAVPPTLPAGNYLLFVEVSKEFDSNATYNDTVFPSPTGIPWSDYGAAYRGQPSVVYKVPFAMIAGTPTTSTTLDYVGYGDPSGLDGDIRPPDSTISTTPGSGAGRLAVVSDGGTQFRVKLTSSFEDDTIPPAQPASFDAVDLNANHVSISFTAPGDDGTTGKVTSYEVRYSTSPITVDNFAAATLSTASLVPVAAGQQQQLALDNLLPETTYSVGIRAIDNCGNVSPLAIYEFTTAARPVGEVDACFIATAAYGTVMAGDVDLLRRFRDLMLKKSVLGELATEAYYTLGPAFAGMIGESEVLRATARDALAPVVSRVRELRF